MKFKLIFYSCFYGYVFLFEAIDAHINFVESTLSYYY